MEWLDASGRQESSDRPKRHQIWSAHESLRKKCGRIASIIREKKNIKLDESNRLQSVLLREVKGVEDFGVWKAEFQEYLDSAHQ